MIKIKNYDSGLRLVVEEMQGFTSVAFNIYVGIGSTNEDETNQGISHIIEHMLFKGTKKRTAFQIAEDLKSIGAQSNAFTSRSDTVFYTKSIKDYAENCVEILSDMVLNSVFDPKELKKERKVIIEELKMYQDDPESMVSEIIDTNFYKGSPYQSNIIGTKKSITEITREQIIEYKERNYVPQNIVLSFAGNITFEEAMQLVEKYFQPLLEGKNEVKQKTFVRRVFPQKPIEKFKFKDNAQSEICISYPCVDVYSDKKYTVMLLNAIWGSSINMSSRLFQQIREKMGLVYKIYSSVSLNEYGGDFSISFSTSTKNVPIALKAVKEEINKLVKKGVTENELSVAKVYMHTSTLLKYENTSYLALSNARDLVVFGKISSKEEFLDNIDKVTTNDIKDMINYVYDNENFMIACVGKNKDIKLLNCFKSGKENTKNKK